MFIPNSGIIFYKKKHYSYLLGVNKGGEERVNYYYYDVRINNGFRSDGYLGVAFTASFFSLNIEKNKGPLFSDAADG